MASTANAVIPRTPNRRLSRTENIFHRAARAGRCLHQSFALRSSSVCKHRHSWEEPRLKPGNLQHLTETHEQSTEGKPTFRLVWAEFVSVHCSAHSRCSIQTFLQKIYLFIFRERRREGEKHQSVASRTPPTGHLARNPGMCPDRESNRQPFGSQASAQSTEPHNPGLVHTF